MKLDLGSTVGCCFSTMIVLHSLDEEKDGSIDEVKGWGASPLWKWFGGQLSQGVESNKIRLYFLFSLYS